MERKSQTRQLLWLVLSLLAAGTAWLYMKRIMEPWEHYVDVEIGRIKTPMGDLYPRWFGTRALLRDGQNPYGPEVSHAIQMAFYGHPIMQTYDLPADQIIDEQRFAYPVYVVFLLAPTAYAGFNTLQAWAPVILIVLIATSVLLWLAVLHWRPPTTTIVVIIFFILSTPQMAQGLRLRQLGFLVAFLLALATWCATRNRLTAAGVILALSTIKPQMVILPIVWLMIWGMGDLPKRWRLLAGFLGALVTLVGAGELILPGWLHEFFLGLAAYRKYVQFKPLLQMMLGTWLGEVAIVALMAGLLALAWKNRKHVCDSPEFTLTLSAFLMGATLALPLLPPFNQVLLLLPILMIVRDWAILPKASRFAFLIIVSWAWVAEIVLLVFPPNLKSSNHLPLLPSSLVLLVPFLLPALLMTRRMPISRQAVSAAQIP